MPGWVDSPTAATAVFLAATLGLLEIIEANPLGVADIIPVDIVANHVLCASIDTQTERLRVSHCTSSFDNPVRWRVVQETSVQSIILIRPPSYANFSGFKLIHDHSLFNFEWTLRYEAPAFFAQMIGKISGSAKYNKLAKTLESLVDV